MTDMADPVPVLIEARDQALDAAENASSALEVYGVERSARLDKFHSDDMIGFAAGVLQERLKLRIPPGTIGQKQMREILGCSSGLVSAVVKRLVAWGVLEPTAGGKRWRYVADRALPKDSRHPEPERQPVAPKLELVKRKATGLEGPMVIERAERIHGWLLTEGDLSQKAIQARLGSINGGCVSLALRRLREHGRAELTGEDGPDNSQMWRGLLVAALG